MNRKNIKLSVSTIVVSLTMITFLWSLTLPQGVQAQAGTPVRVMPLGDSITDGFNVAGGYRIQFYNRLAADGLTGSLNFVGSMSNGPASLLDREHEGHTSWHIADLANNIDGWMTTHTPKIVMLMIGANDILHSQFPNATTRLSSLIDQICAKLPAGGKLYVAQITPLADPAYNDLVNQYNAAIPGIVQSKVNQGKPVFLVNMNSVVTLNDLADGIHPSATGYDKMGNAWYAIIKNDLTAGPVSSPTRTPTAGLTATRTSTPTTGPTNTSTRTPTAGPTSTRTNTPMANATSTRTPTVGASSTPTAGPTSTAGVGACSPVNSSITAPFTFDGAGTFCWQSSNLGTYINSWNTASVTLNGVNVSNVWMGSGSYPAKIGGFWYVRYSSTLTWGHFEAK